MKFSRIQIIYIVVTLLMVSSFTYAGTRGFRFLSIFAVTTWTHTGPPGVHHK